MTQRGLCPLERFMRYVWTEPNTGCWLWVGAAHPRGYGTFCVSTGVKVRTHRFSYEAHKGPIPDGMCVCHKCDTPACVNPDHLFLGTQKDNAADKQSKGRGNQPSGERHGATLHPELYRRIGRELGLRKDNRGTRNGRAKLTVQQVLEIRETRNGQRGLASKYGVDRHTLAKIRRRQLWGHIP